MTTLHEALQKIADALPAYIDGVAAREYLRVVHDALAQQGEQDASPPPVMESKDTAGNSWADEPNHPKTPDAYLVIGSDGAKVWARKPCNDIEDAKETAAVFSQHYPTVNTRALYAAAPAAQLIEKLKGGE